MKVLKRNNTIENFDIDKIKYSLFRVSDEVEMPMTEGDVHTITESVEKKLHLAATGGQVSFKDIHFALIGTLRELSFNTIADAYDASDKSRVKE